MMSVNELCMFDILWMTGHLATDWSFMFNWKIYEQTNG